MIITDIERFCMHDGPGVRTTVFLKGCPLRCKWCHNPEATGSNPQLRFYQKKCVGCGECLACENGVHTFDGRHRVDFSACKSCFECVEVCPTGALEKCGREISPLELLKEVRRDSAFFGSDGGVTLSGGEPFMQTESVEFLKLCHNAGIGTCAETCGFFDGAILPELAESTDILLWDIKHTDTDCHREYTGQGNLKIIENLRRADRLGIKTRVRCILVSGVNTNYAHYTGVARLVSLLSNCEGVELIPYHAYAGAKSEFIGIPDTGRCDWIPSDEEISRAAEILSENGVRLYRR